MTKKGAFLIFFGLQALSLAIWYEVDLSEMGIPNAWLFIYSLVFSKLIRPRPAQSPRFFVGKVRFGPAIFVGQTTHALAIFSLFACYFTVAGCSQPGKTDSATVPIDLVALSDDGNYGVISCPSDDLSEANWVIVRFSDLGKMVYETLDTLQGDVRFADFYAPNAILYACVDSPCTSILTATIDSVPQIDTLIACVGDSCNPPELKDISWAIYAPNHRILAVYYGGKNEYLRIRPDGAFYEIYGFQTDVRCQTFDADESELIWFSAYGLSDTNSTVFHYRLNVYDVDGDTISGGGKFFGNVGKIVRCRGRGEPIYYLRKESDLLAANVWKYDRHAHVLPNRFRVTNFGKDVEVIRFWLVNNSVVCWVADHTQPSYQDRRLVRAPG